MRYVLAGILAIPFLLPVLAFGAPGNQMVAPEPGAYGGALAPPSVGPVAFEVKPVDDDPSGMCIMNGDAEGVFVRIDNMFVREAGEGLEILMFFDDHTWALADVTEDEFGLPVIKILQEGDWH